MKMQRRTFLGAAGAAAATALFGGCGKATTGGKYVSARNLGVCSWSFRLPLDQVAEQMKTMGLKRVHLALQPFLAGAQGGEDRHGGAEGADALDKVKARIASGEWELSATMIGFPQEDYSTLETIKKTGGVLPDDAWEGNKELVRKGAKLTAELGCKLITLHAGFLDHADPVAYKKYSERVKFIVDVCGEAGVGVAFETGQESARDLADFLEKMPGVGVNFDPANMILYAKGDPVEAVKILTPWIKHVHVKDAVKTKTPGEWGTEVPWGDGEVNAPAFLAALDAAGYKGAFAIEREGGDNRVADIALAAKRLLA